MTNVTIVSDAPEDRQFFTTALNNPAITLRVVPQMRDVPRDTDILSVFITALVDDKALKRLPNLTLIACRATGINNIDVATTKKRNIALANVPAYGSITVAEYTCALLLMLARNMQTVLHQSMLQQPDRQIEQGIDLYGKTIGIIGTGNIGLGVARIARGVGMRVLGYDLYPKPQQAKAIGFTYIADITELLTTCDVISLHIPYTTDNHHFLNRDRIKLLRHGCIVLNTARGGLIDTPALVQALQHQHVMAGLDVVEDGYEHIIAKLPNALLTNHNAYNTKEAVQRLNQTTAQNILNFLNGKEYHRV